MQDVPADGAPGPGQPGASADGNHSLLAEDPLTGLPWTEMLLPLIMNWAGASAIHAICLHFVGLGILANIPELQSSHSLLQEATERLAPLMKDYDRLTRFSGNKLLIFSKRSEAGIRGLLVDVSDRLESFGVEAEGRHLPEIRIGMATLGAGGHTVVTVEAVNSLMTEAVTGTIPLSEVVAPRHELAGDAPESLPQSSSGAAERTAAPVSPITPEPEAAEHTTDTDEETAMITRGHVERTPIRQAVEPTAPAADRQPAVSDPRLVLKAVDVVVTGLVATAVVDLDFRGRQVRGKAIGRSSDSHHIGLIAEALGRAITDLLPAGHGVVFKQAVPASTDAGDVVVTVVELLTPDRAQVLFGVAPTEAEPAAGVARSVLHAVNHSLAHLLAAGE